VRACVRLSPLANVYVLSLTPPALYTASKETSTVLFAE